MKKAIILGLFILLVPSVSFAAFDANLKYGSSGTAVKEMQEFLMDQGVCDLPVTGNFFSMTLACVKNFQRKEGIYPVSGYWGPITRNKAVEKLNLFDSDFDENKQTGTVVKIVVPDQTPIVVQPAPYIPPVIEQTPTPVAPVKTEPEKPAYTVERIDQAYGTDFDFTLEKKKNYQKIGMYKITNNRTDMPIMLKSFRFKIGSSVDSEGNVTRLPVNSISSISFYVDANNSRVQYIADTLNGDGILDRENNFYTIIQSGSSIYVNFLSNIEDYNGQIVTSFDPYLVRSSDGGGIGLVPSGSILGQTVTVE